MTYEISHVTHVTSDDREEEGVQHETTHCNQNDVNPDQSVGFFLQMRSYVGNGGQQFDGRKDVRPEHHVHDQMGAVDDAVEVEQMKLLGLENAQLMTKEKVRLPLFLRTAYRIVCTAQCDTFGLLIKPAGCRHGTVLHFVLVEYVAYHGQTQDDHQTDHGRLKEAEPKQAHAFHPNLFRGWFDWGWKVLII